MTEPAGQLIGERYTLTRRLGRGAAADVWRAHDERLGRDVAVKVYRGDAASELGGMQEEIRHLARLSHPGLVGILDAGTEADERSWIVMQLVDGQPLSTQLTRGALPPDVVARYGAELAGALAYVHRHGLIHRDVKPGNVLVGDDGRVHLADFGIARLVDAPSSGLTRTGQVIGTPAYLAPEQVAGEPVGPPADVYALGLVLLEALTGHKEYTGSAVEAATARLNRPPRIPRTLPPGWQSVLASMTDRQPAARPTAADVERRLRRLAGLPAADSTVVMAGDMPTEAFGAGERTLAADRTLAAGPPTRVLSRPAPAPAAAVRRGPHPALVVLIVLLLLAVAAGIAAAVYANKHTPGTRSFISPGHPVVTDNPKLETDLEQLEQAVR